jgi:polyphosphate kinase
VDEAQRAWIRDFFVREVMPVLTPIGLDPAHPFPRVLNKSLNFAVELEGTDAFGRNSGAAIVQAPRALPRVIRCRRSFAGVDYGFVFLSSILHAHVGELFAGMNVLGCYQFRVTRNSDLFVDDEEVKNLRIALQGELPQRHFGDAVRLEVADNCSEVMTGLPAAAVRPRRDDDLYRVPGIVNLVRLMQVPDQVDRPDLKYPPFQPGLPKVWPSATTSSPASASRTSCCTTPSSPSARSSSCSAGGRRPEVVAIKMTVYRTGTDSVLMEHLLRAAERARKSPSWWN